MSSDKKTTKATVTISSAVGVMDKIELNGKVYVAEGSEAPKPTGTRAVVVVDRGWIFAGDLTEENGRICLKRAVWVFRWESVGFDGVIADPKSSKVTLKKMKNDVDLPLAAEVFRIPVSDDWGL